MPSHTLQMEKSCLTKHKGLRKSGRHHPSVSFCLPQRNFPSYLFSPEVQALVVELADEVPSQDVRVDLQQGAQLQTKRGPPVSLGATRGELGGPGARG